jgi:PAS domain S-box-containing protein
MNLPLMGATGGAESDRLEALRAHRILDTAPEAAFDDLVVLAANVAAAPIAVFVLYDYGRVWFKASLGWNRGAGVLEHAFFAPVLAAGGRMFVEDCLLRAPFAAHPLSQGVGGLRMLAATPVLDASGHCLGSLCVADPHPGNRSAAQLDALERLARQISDQMSLRLLRQRARDLHEPQATYASANAALPELPSGERRFWQAFQCAPIGMALVGLDGRWLHINEALVRTLGYSATELASLRFQDVTHPEDLAADLALVEQILSGAIDRYQMEKRYIHRDGHLVHALLSVSMARDDAGQPLYFISQIKDITDLHKAYAMAEAALAEKTTLLNEIHHRVKNNLQVISSLLSLQLGANQDPSVRAVLAEAQGRVSAMALIHQLLYEGRELSSVNLSDYLRRLGGLVARSTATTARRVRLEFVLDQSLRLDPQKAVPFGLLANEVLTNAYKHAFPDDRRGTVTVELARSSSGEASLTIADDGVGLPADFKLLGGSSLGARLIPLLCDQAKARMSVDSQPDAGARFTFSFTPADAAGQGG